MGSRFEVLSKNRLASLRLDLPERAAIDADAPLVVRVAHLRLNACAREVRLDINGPLRTLVFLRIALIPATEILQIRIKPKAWFGSALMFSPPLNWYSAVQA